MQGPNVRNELRDEKNNVAYIGMAYRILTSAEMRREVRSMLSQLPKGKRNPKNKTFYDHNDIWDKTRISVLIAPLLTSTHFLGFSQINWNPPGPLATASSL
jgi:hypothetical protein